MELLVNITPEELLQSIKKQLGVTGLLSLASEAMTLCMHDVQNDRFDDEFTEQEKELYLQLRELRSSIDIAEVRYTSIKERE